MPAEVVEEMKAPGPLRPVDPGGVRRPRPLHGGRVPGAVELGRTSPAFRSTFGTNVGIGSQGLVMFGTRRAEGRSTCPASPRARSSPPSRSPSRRPAPTAPTSRPARSATATHYVLNGSKRFITNANKADLFTVMARTDPDKTGAGGVSAFLVERDLPGLSVGKPEKKMGQQGAHICDVIFDNVRVPAENRLGARGRGLQGRHAGAGPRPPAHLGGLRRRRRAADRRLRRLRHRAQAVRPADRQLPAGPGR